MTEKLILNPGTTLQLQFPNRGNERLSSKAIGFMPNHSILVTTPRYEEKVILVRLDQAVTVRYFQDTLACAFETKVIQICNKPFPYLHLAYPDTIRYDTIRQSRRINSDLPCTLNCRGKRYKSQLLDISTEGARLKSAVDPGDITDSIDLMTTIPIGPVKRLLSVAAFIRSKHRDDNGYYILGLEFKPLVEDDFILISGYIYSQIVERGEAR